MSPSVRSHVYVFHKMKRNLMQRIGLLDTNGRKLELTSGSPTAKGKGADKQQEGLTTGIFKEDVASKDWEGSYGEKGMRRLGKRLGVIKQNL